MSLKGLKGKEGFRFLSEEIDRPESGSIINKDAPVLETFRRLSREWTMEISMNEMEGSDESGSSLVDDPSLITSKAWFTDGIRRGGGSGSEVKTRDKGLGMHRFESGIVEMRESSMPKGEIQRRGSGVKSRSRKGLVDSVALKTRDVAQHLRGALEMALLIELHHVRFHNYFHSTSHSPVCK